MYKNSTSIIFKFLILVHIYHRRFLDCVMSNSYQSPIVPIPATTIKLFYGYKPPKNGKFFTSFLFYNECQLNKTSR
jgi:hypothetical protein